MQARQLNIESFPCKCKLAVSKSSSVEDIVTNNGKSVVISNDKEGGTSFVSLDQTDLTKQPLLVLQDKVVSSNEQLLCKVQTSVAGIEKRLEEPLLLEQQDIESMGLPTSFLSSSKDNKVCEQYTIMILYFFQS